MVEMIDAWVVVSMMLMRNDIVNVIIEHDIRRSGHIS